MAILDLFSKRQRRLRGDVPDVYVYGIPKKFRIQIINILKELAGRHSGRLLDSDICSRVVRTLRKELGYLSLAEFPYPDISRSSDFSELIHFFGNEPDVENFIDGLEVFLRFFGDQTVVDEVNGRLAELSVGYEYNMGQFIRKDSEHLHAEVIQPALVLLSSAKLQGANAEYRQAHAHFRAREYGDCLSECLKCFESTLKVICVERRIAYDAKRDTAAKLISAVLAAEIVPASVQAQFTALASLLASGIPTPRNRHDGHGAGSLPHHVPKEIAEFLLYQTAATVLFLAESAGLK